MEICKNIFRIVIPFEDIYTSVFLIQTDEGMALFDTATFPSDMDKYVFPVLDSMNADLKYVFISHNHRDHAGGLERVVEKYPEVAVVTGCAAIKEKFRKVIVAADGYILMNCLRAVSIPGHTVDSMGLLDVRSGTLLSGDCLQLYGIFGSGKWGANITLPAEHIAAIESLKSLELKTIIASHDYHPCGFVAHDAEEINLYLDQCVAALRNIHDLICAYPEMNDEEIAGMYNETKKLPTLGARVVGALRGGLE